MHLSVKDLFLSFSLSFSPSVFQINELLKDMESDLNDKFVV